MFRGVELSENEFRELFRFAKPSEMMLDCFYVDSEVPEQAAAFQERRMAIWNRARELIGDDRLQNRPPDPQRMRYGFKK